MLKDKSEKERYALTQQIVRLEEKEDDFMALKNRHEERVANLASQFQQLSSYIESLLTYSEMSTPYKMQELEKNQEVGRQMSEYVSRYFDDIDEASRAIRRNFDDKREKLLSERSRLPWE